MLNFCKSVFGILLLSLGGIIIILDIKNRKNEERDKYGNNIKIIGGAIIFIIVGISMLVRELMKL